MSFIMLHRNAGERPVLVNLDHVVLVDAPTDNARITFRRGVLADAQGNEMYVTESFEEVAQLVDEAEYGSEEEGEDDDD